MTELDHTAPKKFNRFARHKARRLALQALYQWDLSGNNIADIETHFLTEQDIKKTDIGFFREILQQVPAKIDLIDNAMEPFLDRPKKELNPIELAIIRIGTYELLFRPDNPYKVIINEAVELAKVFGAEEGHKYVNGVLDQVAAKTRIHEKN